MRIPKSFNLFGETITVRIIPKAIDGEGTQQLVGLAKYCENEIVLATHDIYGTPIAKKNIEQSFFHELMHFIFDKVAPDMRSNEELVDLTAALLHQMFITAKY